MVKYLDNDKFYEEIKKGTILVDFYADWCGPCRMLGKVLESVDANILKVNTDRYPDIAKTYGVMSIPTMILFKDGKEIAKNVGFLNKDEVEEFINQ